MIAEVTRTSRPRTAGSACPARPTRLAWLTPMVGVFVCSGCQTPNRLRTPVRYERGIIFVLPGIEGRSFMNRNVALGLYEGGVGSAIEIFDWTTGVPANFVIHLTAYQRNKRQAARLAKRIVAYRERYPGNPVHLVGHSGGGGVCVLALEALPAGRQIDMAILLAPALSAEYDLSQTLRRTGFGLTNFYSNRDVSFLKVGTSALGSIDRERGYSAGAVGFRRPSHLSDEERELYDEKLRQVRWVPRLKHYGASGTHIGWTTRQFAREYLADIIRRNEAKHVLPASEVD